MKVGDLVKHREDDCLSHGSVEATAKWGSGIVIEHGRWDDRNLVRIYWPTIGESWEFKRDLEIVSEGR